MPQGENKIIQFVWEGDYFQALWTVISAYTGAIQLFANMKHFFVECRIWGNVLKQIVSITKVVTVVCVRQRVLA